MVKLQNPAPRGWVSQEFKPGVHRGRDYGYYNANVEASNDIVAAAGGRVSKVYKGNQYNDGWGNMVEIDHGYGVKTTYNHFRPGGIAADIFVGKQVGPGHFLGDMGDTGEARGVHLHFELWVNGVRIDPAPYFTRDLPGIPVLAGNIGTPAAQLGPDQRRANATARRRADATTQSEHVGGGATDLLKGAVGNFVGWKHGEFVNGTDIWIKGTSGAWFHASGFEGGDRADFTKGLPDLNPTAPAPLGTRDRKATTTLRGRTLPTTQSEVTGYDLEPGAIGTFDGWTRGEMVDGEDRWLHGALTDRWFSLRYLEPRNVDGLPELPSPTKPSPTLPPVNVLDPKAPWKNQTPDYAKAKWIGSPNYDYREPGPTDHITLHWMAGTLAGTDAQFQRPGEITDKGRGTSQSTNYGVGLTEVHQYVKEGRYVHSDGNAQSNATTISIEHEGGYEKDGKIVPVAKATLDLSAELIADIAKRKGWKRLEWMVNVFPHKHYVNTTCPGTLDVDYLLAKANGILNPPKPEPDPTPQPEPQPEPDKPAGVTINREWIENLRDQLNEMLE